jgi:hypothetical protein
MPVIKALMVSCRPGFWEKLAISKKVEGLAVVGIGVTAH